MSRESKFRAWDKINKRMWSTGEEGLMENGFTFETYFKKETGELTAIVYGEEFLVTDDPYPMYDNEEIELPLIQCTGLKDRHGVDIYEGDVIRYWDEIDEKIEMLGFVEWERCWWSVNLHPAFLQENDIMDADINYEVVGNIYKDRDMIEWIKK